jgi:hypothetical protein
MASDSLEMAPIEKCQTGCRPVRVLLGGEGRDIRFHGPCRIAKPSMNSILPNVKARANFLGLTATAHCQLQRLIPMLPLLSALEALRRMSLGVYGTSGGRTQGQEEECDPKAGHPAQTARNEA